MCRAKAIRIGSSLFSRAEVNGATEIEVFITIPHHKHISLDEAIRTQIYNLAQGKADWKAGVTRLEELLDIRKQK